MSTRIVGYAPLMKAKDIGEGATAYTDSMPFSRCTGEVCVFIVLTGSGTATIIQQCSMDDANWYSPVNASGSALGTVTTANAATTGTWISYSPVMAPHVRFKVTEAGGAEHTAASVTLIFQEER